MDNMDANFYLLSIFDRITHKFNGTFCKPAIEVGQWLRKYCDLLELNLMGDIGIMSNFIIKHNARRRIKKTEIENTSKITVKNKKINHRRGNWWKDDILLFLR